MNRGHRTSLYGFALVVLALLLGGCAGSVKNMRSVSEEMAITEPPDGKSLIVFMRPSGIGYAIQSSVFDIDNGEPELVGIVAAKKKVSYLAEPGNHLFMVVGESGDFMTAELLPNKTYYALVTPRLGVWKARFSLKPVTAGQLDGAEFTGWLNDCQWVEKTEASEQWANDNMASIRSKYDQYFPKWMAKPDSDKPTLTPGDGI